MTKRSEKYNRNYQVETSKGFDEERIPAGWANSKVYDSNSWSSEVYPRKLSAKYIEDKVTSNIWALKAIQLNAKASVGVGFDDTTDKEIRDNMYIREIKLAVENLEIHFEIFLKVNVINAVVAPYFESLPSTVCLLGRDKGKYAGKVIVNYGTEEQQTYPIFDVLQYQLGRLPAGEYIHHIKLGYGRYGTIPGAALKRLSIQYNFETSIDSWYKNDAIPDLIMTFFGIDPDSEEAKKLKRMINRNYQGVENRGKATLLFTRKSRAEGDPSIYPVTKNIIDRNSMDFDTNVKFDLAAFYGVPYWMLNLTVSGKLGGSTEREADLMWYKAVTVSDMHEILRDELWSVYWPDKVVKFNELDITKFIPAVQQPLMLSEIIAEELNKGIDTLIQKEYKSEGVQT